MHATFAGLQGLAGYSQHEFSLALPEVRTAPGFLTSPDYFQVLGTRPIIGRAFDSRDEASRSLVAVISYSLWAGDFAGDPSVTERSLRVGGIDVQIVGVAPPFFTGIDMRPGDPAPAVWLPLSVGDRVLPGSRRAPTDDNLSFVGRLHHGVALAQVRAESDVVAARLAATRSAPASPARADVSRELEDTARILVPHVSNRAANPGRGPGPRMRERREFAAGPRLAPAPGDCGSPRHRRITGPRHSSVAH